MSIKDFNIKGKVLPDSTILILRENYNEHKAGTPFRRPRNTSETYDHGTYVAPLKGGATLFWVPSSYLLPINDYLQRKPRKRFWSVGKKKAWKDGEPYFITDIKQGNVATVHQEKPFRFESQGEAIFWMAQQKLDPRQYILQQWIFDI
jgi:hypothetical protein